MIQYAEIALNLPFANQDTLTYEIIPNSKAEVGKRVEVEIRNRVLEGVIIEIHSMMPNYKTKPIKRIIDKNPIITSEQIELGMWMKDFYLSTLGECLYKMIPQGRRKITSKVDDIAVEKDLLKLNPEQEKIFEDIKKFKGEESIHLIYGITGSGKTEVYIHLIEIGRAHV